MIQIGETSQCLIGIEGELFYRFEVSAILCTFLVAIQVRKDLWEDIVLRDELISRDRHFRSRLAYPTRPTTFTGIFKTSF